MELILIIMGHTPILDNYSPVQYKLTESRNPFCFRPDEDNK